MSVCCLPVSVIPEHYLEKYVASKDTIFTEINSSRIVWKERSEAESDRAYKQIIPYLLVMNERGQLACYRRQGTETRLHNLYSIGVGGHVESEDERDTFEQTILQGAVRELHEEFKDMETFSYTISYCGCIHEEETDVGFYHLGIVYRVSIHGDKNPSPDEELADLRWMEREKLNGVVLELWSELALKLLRED